MGLGSKRIGLILTQLCWVVEKLTKCLPRQVRVDDGPMEEVLLLISMDGSGIPCLGIPSMNIILCIYN